MEILLPEKTEKRLKLLELKVEQLEMHVSVSAGLFPDQEMIKRKDEVEAQIKELENARD